MNNLHRMALASLLTLTAHCAHALVFPEDLQAPTAQELRERISGKTFVLELSDLSRMRVYFVPDGRFHLYGGSATGTPDSGEWKTVDGKICRARRLTAPSCSDIRFQGASMFVRESNGDVFHYLAQ